MFGSTARVAQQILLLVNAVVSGVYVQLPMLKWQQIATRLAQSKRVCSCRTARSWKYVRCAVLLVSPDPFAGSGKLQFLDLDKDLNQEQLT